MKNSDQSHILKLRTVITVALIGQIFIIFGVIANITQVFESKWFNKVLSSNFFQWVSYALNILLSGFLVYIYIRTKKYGDACYREVTAIRSQLSTQMDQEKSLWRRLVRTVRSLALSHIPNPTQRDSLEPMLDELMKRLPNNGVDFKIAVAKPMLDGKFKILANRGMDPPSVYSIEQKADWKLNKSLFSDGLDLDDEKRYCIYNAGEKNYQNIQRTVGTGSSVLHFIVAIKCDFYPLQQFPKKCLGVLSIGIPKNVDYTKDKEEELFLTVYPIVKGIETILLNYSFISREGC